MLKLDKLRQEALAGLTTSFAMVPEVVAFAFVAGVNPITGLYAAFTAGLVTALWGGRPGMISGGAGSLAVVSVALVATRGVEYLFAAVLLMGVLQLVIGLLGWGKFIELVPHSVMLGFVNGLAIVILLAQLRQIPWGQPDLLPTLGLLLLTIAITAFLPRLTRAIPSALAAIIVTTVVARVFPLHAKQVGDLANIHGAFPAFHLPSVPLTWQTLWTIFPFSVTLAGVGLTESLLTQSLVDEITETRSSHNRECVGQGLGNIVTGLFAGMGGCAMIGQTMINLTSGGRGRLSGVIEALSVLAFIVIASGLISLVPMAALIGVMFVVVFQTFSWSSLRQLARMPRLDAAVLVLVTLITIFRDLATGVLAGVIVSALGYAWRTAGHLSVVRQTRDATESATQSVVYRVSGPLFFGSVKPFLRAFQTAEDPESIMVDFSEARLFGHSALEAIENLARKYGRQEKRIRLRGLSAECRTLLEQSETRLTEHVLPVADPAA